MNKFTEILKELGSLADDGQFGNQEWNDKFDEMVLSDPTLSDEEKNDWFRQKDEIKNRESKYDNFIKEHSDEIIMYDPETFEPMTAQEYKNKYKK